MKPSIQDLNIIPCSIDTESTAAHLGARDALGEQDGGDAARAERFSPLVERADNGCHVVIDGAVDAPDTLGKMLGPERFQELRATKGMEHDGLMLPERIADTYYHVAKQHRSTWTFEMDLRAFSDLAWWNH